MLWLVFGYGLSYVTSTFVYSKMWTVIYICIIGILTLLYVLQPGIWMKNVVNVKFLVIYLIIDRNIALRTSVSKCLGFYLPLVL